MNEKLPEWIRALEAEWSKPDGFLGTVREGNFDRSKGADFLATLRSIKPPEKGDLDRRLVASVWYIPLFLSWQKERIIEKGGDATAFVQLTNQVEATVQDILGIP